MCAVCEQWQVSIWSLCGSVWSQYCCMYVCTHQCQAHTPPDPHHHWDTRLTPPAGHLSSEREYRIQVQTVHFYKFGGRFHSAGFLYNLEKQPWKLWQLSFLTSFFKSTFGFCHIWTFLSLGGWFLLKLTNFSFFFFFTQIFSLRFFFFSSTIQR